MTTIPARRASRQTPLLTTLALALLLPVAALRAQTPAAAPAIAGPPLGVTGTVRFHGAFPSRLGIPARNVEVWLPPGYETSPRTTRYPVLYMHDGQNVFAPATSSYGVDWAVDEVMTRLIAERRVRPAIVVAVWTNGATRFAEYMPEKAVPGADSIATGIPGMGPLPRPVVSDTYLRFLVEEVKPFVDRTYRTRTGRADTFIMGSSMGGLISAYAMTEYPDVFGGAAGVSTHWPIGEGAMIEYMRRSLPAPATHRLYYDSGTEALDSHYGPWQKRMDAVMRAAPGWVEGRNWTSRTFVGVDHSERAWRLRVEEPLVFLLGTTQRPVAKAPGRRP